MKPSAMKLAIAMARKSLHPNFRMGAVITRGSRIISSGFNQRKSHTQLQYSRRENPLILGLHAEKHACLGVDAADLIGATIYVARFRRLGTLAPSMPCASCRKDLTNMGFRRAFYYDKEGEIKEYLF